MILAVLQARMTSRRLPGKVLRPILGKPLLELQLERVRRARRIDRLVVATSRDRDDDPVEKLCAAVGVDCFRGSLDDVLDRYYRAAQQYGADHVVRLTGDCPLADPALIDDVADFYFAGNYDLATNTVRPTFPDGLDVWVFRFSALERAWREADLLSQREHVTLFIMNRTDLFAVGSYERTPDLSQLRWTVDEPDDFEFVAKVYGALYPQNPAFTTADVLALLEQHPEMGLLNAHFVRDEGLQISLAKDRRIRPT